MAKADALQDERDFLVVQLSVVEEERAAAAQDAAVASAEAQHVIKVNQMLEVRAHRLCAAQKGFRMCSF
jgi:hypothetical protein